MVPCKSTAEEVSFEWSHHRISSTDSKVRTAWHVSINDSAIERVKSFYGEQFTLSTQFIKPNFRVLLLHRYSNTVSLETNPFI